MRRVLREADADSHHGGQIPQFFLSRRCVQCFNNCDRGRGCLSAHMHSVCTALCGGICNYGLGLSSSFAWGNSFAAALVQSFNDFCR